MRVVIVAESFLPIVNGVVNSVLRTCEYLRDEGHDVLIIAPRPREGQIDSHYLGFPIVRVPTVDVPKIDSLPIGVPLPRVYTAMRNFRPDVVHLASPFVLGGSGAFAAKALKVPSVAVFQTDVPGFTYNYGLTFLTSMSWRWVRAMHNNCTLTLAPSSQTIAELQQYRVQNVFYWGRGVDTERFSPSHRSDELAQQWLSQGEKLRGETPGTAAAKNRKIIGFVGRLAAEKSVEKLASIDGRDDVQLVIIGDGPTRQELENSMPSAVFTGALYGAVLAEAFATLDVFAHAGAYETFCQAIQEAQASELPAIAPRAGGPIDLVDDGTTGYLLDVESFSADLPAAVDRLFRSFPDASPLYKTFGEAAFERVQNKTWPALCEQLFGYYQQAIDMHHDG